MTAPDPALQAKRQAQNVRKQKSRQGKPRPVEVNLAPAERATLTRLRTVRGGATPYSIVEYIATLIRRDEEQLAFQLSLLAPCGYCGQPFPGGCGGVHRGDGDCELARVEKLLAL